MNEVNPPGVPDDYDITKIIGYEPPNLAVSQARVELLATSYLVATVLWSGAVLLTLCGFIFTGSLFFWFVGYAVTVPYLIVGYKHRNAIDYAEELKAWCNLDC